MLRSAAGVRPGIDAPISAETIDRLSPPPRAAATVGRHFSDRGFNVLSAGRNSIVIAATQETFERHFAVELVHGTDGAYTCVKRRRPAGRRRQAAGPGFPARPDDPTELPIDRLPAAVRRLVAAVALDAAATPDTERIDP